MRGKEGRERRGGKGMRMGWECRGGEGEGRRGGEVVGEVLFDLNQQ